ncbi:MAG: flagellar basal-body rod protein FlgG [Gammaproteobacteria bacterium]|nr:flagellar basal-body rod protein FlgG [Gammaproteobacteria bacterium]MDH5728283.1 flagellar basal-body rod protein FlgG [Gammaproteobacteria bacterium]
MDRALWVSKTGLETQQTRMAIISNNLANVSTTGYKRSRGIFEDLIYQNVRQPGGLTSENTYLPSGLMMGSGVRTVATEKLHAQGNFVQTENAFDVAVSGRGYLQVVMPDGQISYTRDGSFRVNAQSQLVTASGYLVEGGISIPQEAMTVSIASDGVVAVTLPGVVGETQVGNLQLADFVNPTGLEPIGENFYRETVASGPPQIGTPGLDGLGNLMQGYLESSNVNVAEELVNMIETQRAYEMNSKAITATDGMLRYISQNL